MGRGDEARGDRRVFVAGAADGGGLVDALAAAGWQAAGASAWEEWATTFARGEAQVAVVDARRSGGGLPVGTATLGAVVKRRGAAMLVIAPRGHDALLHDALRAGATHVVADPSPGELAAAVESASRHVRRLAGRTRDATGWIGPDAALAAIDERLGAVAAAPTAILIATDRFDVVNAAYGRLAGDRLLRAVAARIARGAAGPPGHAAVPARIGGSEFVVLVEPGEDEAGAIAGRIAAALAEPFVVDGSPLTLVHRIAAVVPAAGDGAARTIERLRDLIRADASSEDGTAIGDDAADTLAADLHRAIGRDEIEMLYQPQVRLSDGWIVGVEALARWEHPRLGTLGAEPLFAAAARAGLAAALSEHVQSLALCAVAGWPAWAGAIRLSINVTAHDVAAAGFLARFLVRLADSGFPAARLTVEVTETELIRNLDAASVLLDALRTAGCRVALDDFGTGYSSLAYLRALPVDYLKIDKAITRDVTGSARDRAVLVGIVGIAHALGVATIAEGVETPQQRDALAALGCDLYQGFLCAEPVDAAALARLLGEG